MPKKKKLKLNDLKVQSFVTDLKGQVHMVKVKGGVNSDTPIPCGGTGTDVSCETICGTCDTCNTECTCLTCETCATCESCEPCGGSGYKTCIRPWECTLDC